MDVLQPDGYGFYCFQHNAQFMSYEAYESHMEECIKMLTETIMCVFVENDLVCKKKCANLSELVLHTREKHGKIVCCECGMYFDTMEGLETHEHTHMDVYKGKKFFYFIYFLYFNRKQITLLEKNRVIM